MIDKNSYWIYSAWEIISELGTEIGIENGKIIMVFNWSDFYQAVYLEIKKFSVLHRK